MLKYLPNDQRALYNARQILMSNSYGVVMLIQVPIPKGRSRVKFDRLHGEIEGKMKDR